MLKSLIALMALALFLASCGSGDGDPASDGDASEADPDTIFSDTDIVGDATDGDVLDGDEDVETDLDPDYGDISLITVPCTADIATDTQALSSFMRVVVLNLGYGADFHELIPAKAMIGYNYGPNTVNYSDGYHFSLEAADGAVVESWIAPPAIAVFMEDTVGCTLLEPDAADSALRFDFDDSNVAWLRIRDAYEDLVCINGSYEATGVDLLRVDLSACRDALCVAFPDTGDPWCGLE